jgi:hypothetical protein
MSNATYELHRSRDKAFSKINGQDDLGILLEQFHLLLNSDQQIPVITLPTEFRLSNAISKSFSLSIRKVQGYPNTTAHIGNGNLRSPLCDLRLTMFHTKDITPNDQWVELTWLGSSPEFS